MVRDVPPRGARTVTNRSSPSGSSTLYRKSSTPHTTAPRRNSCLLTACPQIHESIDEGFHDIENDPLSSGDERAQWDDKAAEAEHCRETGGERCHRKASAKTPNSAFRSLFPQAGRC